MHTEVAYAEAATEVQLGAMHIEVAHGTEPNLPEPPSSSMETLMLESFEAYQTHNALIKSGRWSGYTGVFLVDITVGGGRDGNRCISLRNLASLYSVFTELKKAVKTIVVGFAVKWDDLPDTAADGPLVLQTGYGWNRLDQLSLTLGTNGKLQLRRGGYTGTLIQEGTTILQASTWYFIEMRAYIHNTAGNYEVRINESVELSGTNVDTQESATDSAVTIVHFASGKSSTGANPDRVHFDDVYIRGDETGDFAGGFLGNVIIEAINPNTDGVYSQWSLSTGTDDYALIDEQFVSVTDYLYSSTAGERVTTNFADLTGTEAILGVMAYHHMSLKAEGLRELKPFCRNGGNHADGGNRISREVSYLEGVSYSYDPATNVAWTVSGFNVAEFGVEVV
jgi:hypothetical protein